MRQKSEPITCPDTGNESLEYWNNVLRSHNLSMARGQSIGRHKVVSVGTSIDQELAMLGEHDISKPDDSGKTHKRKPLANKSITLE